MFVRLFLLLIVVPIVELMILMRLARRLHWEGTLALVIATGLLGAWLARRAGLKAMARVQADLSNGIAPAASVLDGLLILVAGAMLVTPGVLTDACGFALLVPAFRRWTAGRIRRAIEARITTIHGGAPDVFVDVEGRSSDAEEPATPLPGPHDQGAQP